VKALLESGFNLLSDQGERLGVTSGQVCQQLAVQVDASFLNAVDKLAVGHAMLTGSGIDPGDPQTTEIPFLVATIAVSVLQGLHDRLVGDFEELAPGAPETFSQLQNFLMALAGYKSSFYTHGLFSLE
jgi:hypothetical protein